MRPLVHYLPGNRQTSPGSTSASFVAFLVGSTPAIYQPIFGTPLKWVVMCALSLYLNFINIFQLLLGLTGEREG